MKIKEANTLHSPMRIVPFEKSSSMKQLNNQINQLSRKFYSLCKLDRVLNVPFQEFKSFLTWDFRYFFPLNFAKVLYAFKIRGWKIKSKHFFLLIKIFYFRSLFHLKKNKRILNNNSLIYLLIVINKIY